MQNSIETTATVEANRHLVLDDEIPAPISKRVRVIVLLDDDVNESDWLKSASSNEVFDFLSDDTEDIYSATDGNPIEDEA
jgi:hypothetical protein